MASSDHDQEPRIFRFGDCEVDTALRQLRRRGEMIALEPKPFELLVYLIRHRDRVVPKDDLMATLWPGIVVSDSSLSSTVRRARAALDASADCIQGVRKIGYRFAGAIEERDAGSTPRDTRAAEVGASIAELSPGFIGRRRELEELDLALQRGIAGHGSLVVTPGEPGIGKTRTLDELVRRARARDCEVLAGRCYEGEGGQAFWPWVQVFRAFADGRDPREVDAILGVEAGDIALLTAAIAGTTSLPSSDPQMLRIRVLDSAVAVLLRAARQGRPLLIVLDDLHWADSASISLLHALTRRIADVPLVIVGTYRDIEVDGAHPLAVMLATVSREGSLQRIALRGLCREEAADLLATLAGYSVDATTVQTIYEVSEGNPFFVREYWRLLLEEGAVVLGEHGWEPRHASVAPRVPETVGELIRRRVRRLSPACVQLLTIAAVVGREFSHDVLALVSTSSVRDTIDLLDEAANAQVIDEMGGDVGRYRFAHALIRETLYDGMTRLRRAALHRYVGEAIETLAPAALTKDMVAELAHHFLQAGEAGSTQQAIEYAERAAAEATQACAYDAAVDYLERAVQLLRTKGVSPSVTDTRLCELYLQLAAALDRAGEGQRMRAAFAQAADLARAIPAPTLLARAAIGMTSRWVVEDAVAIALLEEALSSLTPEEAALRALVQARLAQALYFMDDTRPRREQLCAEARATASRVGDPRILGEVLADCLEALFECDGLREQDELAEAMRAAAEAAGDARLRLLARAWEIGNLMRHGLLNEADHRVAEFSRLAAELRQRRFLYHAAAFEAALLLGRGHLEQAEARSNEALRIGAPIDAVAAAWINWAQLHHIRHEQGRFEEFLSEGLVVRLPTTGKAAASYQRSGRWALPHLFSELGRDAEAKATFDSLMAAGLDKLPPNNSRGTRIPALFSMADTCATLNDVEAAGPLYELLLPYADQWHVIGWGNVVYSSSHVMLGVLRGVQQRWDEADAHFDEASRQHIEQKAAPAQARNLFQRARLLRRRGRRSDLERAQQYIEQALRIAEEYGLRGVEARLRRLGP